MRGAIRECYTAASREVMSFLFGLLLVVCAVLPAAAQEPQAAGGGYSADELPLGKPGLKESRTTQQVTTGVT